MNLAVLPFNVAEGTDPVLGRQFANFIAETVRNTTQAEVQPISLLAQTQEDGVARSVFVNMGDALMEREIILPLFRNANAERVMHGFLARTGDDFTLDLRVETESLAEPVVSERHEFALADLFKELQKLLAIAAEQAGRDLPAELTSGDIFVGTHNPDAFLRYMTGIDTFKYIQQTNGMISREYDPKVGMDALLQALQIDPSFDMAYDLAIELCRITAHFKLGQFDNVRATLEKLTELKPQDFRPWAALGEAYQQIGHVPRASDAFEAALQRHLALGDDVETAEKQVRASLYSRIGMLQLNMGMPANAERNFRSAADLEKPESAALELLAGVLNDSGRAHEIPALWREHVERYPGDARGRAQYATSLMRSGEKQKAVDEFEKALAEVEEKTLIKRFYAPVLAEMDELDRAMDFYEDFIDVNPTDVPTLLEYAQTLTTANREFEVPSVLKSILSANPDPNTRAMVMARLIELEQPKRAEAVEEARLKMENGDFEGVIRDLKPLRNWLADYWKLWALLCHAYNRVEMREEAQDAAQRLVNLYPGFEAAYAELVEALAAQGKHEDAYYVMQHAANNVGTLGTHVNLALAAKRAGHEDEARTLAKRIREAVGPNEELEPVLAEIEA